MKTSKVYFLVAALLFLLVSQGYSAPKKDNIAPTDSSGLIANTPLGKLRGAHANGVYVWKGIRYAQAPVGELRFKAPVPVQAWAGVKDALQYGAVSPQQESAIAGIEPQSEDCLFLNVWSPAADGKKRPVMFWIHGGGFLIGSGSSPLYDGSNMAKNGDVVIVTINYRLGPLGFLYFKDIAPDAGMENNLGMKDQIAALKWVKQNIAAFGGDPEQVTIFGESAGGTSVETLMAAPSTKGLFTKAIVQSGPAAIIWQPKSATAITEKYLSLLGLKNDEVEKLKTIPLDTLRAAEDKLVDYMVAELPDKVFCPTVDGDLLPYDIYQCVKNVQDIPLLIGTNMNEASIFVSNKLKIMPKNAAGFEKYFATVTEDKDTRNKVTSAYKGYPSKRAVQNILTDAVFRIPAIRLAECHLNNAPVYMYRFQWTTPALNMVGLRCFHGLDVPFVFGTVDNGSGKFLKLISAKKTRTRLISEMQTAWINFAKYGDPNGKGGGNLNWKPYTTTDRNTMLFDKHSQLVADPSATERKAWVGVKYY